MTTVIRRRSAVIVRRARLVSASHPRPRIIIKAEKYTFPYRAVRLFGVQTRCAVRMCVCLNAKKKDFFLKKKNRHPVFFSVLCLCWFLQ